MGSQTSSLQTVTRTLIFHIGLPKTGTTMIQEFFKASHLNFENNKVGVLSKDGFGAHYLLGEQLRKLDAIGDGGSIFLGKTNFTDYFPDLKDYSSYIISAENMSEIGDNGISSIIRFAEDSDANLKMACTVRNPVEWLFSNWSQIIKSDYIDWIDYVKHSRLNKVGFLSTSINPWVNKSVTSIVIIKYHHKDFLENFLGRIEMSHLFPKNQDTFFLNNGVGLAGNMYCALMVKEIYKILGANERHLFQKVRKDYLKRMLLDIFDNASPLFEISQIYEKQILESNNLIGFDSYEELIKYCKEWIKDARTTLNFAMPLLDSKSISVVNDFVEDAIMDVEKMIDTPYQFKKFPQRNFVNHLPINGQFIGLVRSIAIAIQLGFRTYSEIAQD